MRESGSEQYVIGEGLGRGRLGEVYAGRDGTGAACAVRILRDELGADVGVTGRFLQDRELFYGARDPRLVRVHDLVVEDGSALAVVTDLVVGQSLRRSVGAAGTAPDDAGRIGAQVAQALAALHAAGLTHGDLKPENVLLDEAGTARLSDFGFARLFGTSSLAGTETLLGTAAYCAPELAGGSAPTEAGDLYALGILLYELASGAPPFAGDTAQLTHSHALATPRRPAAVPNRLWDVIAALLAKSPGDRPSSAHSVALLLDSPAVPDAALVLDAPAVLDVPIEPVALRVVAPAVLAPAVVLPSSRRSPRRIAGVLAVVAAAGLGGTTWAMFSGSDAPAQVVGNVSAVAAADAPPASPAPTAAAVRGTTNGPIAYVSKQDGAWKLYRMNPDGSGQAPLTDLDADTSPPVFSPDGRQIAFSSFVAGEQGLHVMNVDGTGRTRVSDTGRWPTFSPDGTRLTFDGMWNRRDEVFTVGVDRTGLIRLTDDGRGATPRTPVFSPDGTKILYTGFADDNQAVFLMNTDGTGRSRLAPRGALPAFSPDGTKVTFTGTADNEVYVIDVDGSDLTQLTHNGARDWYPRFSPDGKQIVFTSNRHSAADSENFEAYVMNADGTDQKRLTADNLGRSLPAFSPDGTKIAFSAVAGDPAQGSYDVYVTNADGTGTTPVGAKGANPVWGPSAP